MIDQLRTEIQNRLNQLLAEAEKLRKALAALDPRGGPAPARRPRPARRAAPRSTRAPSARRAGQRTPPGATKAKVLQALSDGKAMTAGEVAAAAGVGRGTASTTLTRLANSGEVRKAERGYVLPTSPGAGAGAGGSQPRSSSAA